jgi:invasion protein IalB
MICRTTISGTWDTGQIAVRVDLIEREGDGTARLQIFLPVGLQLQAGVKLPVDKGKPHLVPYVWCLTNTCSRPIWPTPTRSGKWSPAKRCFWKPSTPIS